MDSEAAANLHSESILQAVSESLAVAVGEDYFEILAGRLAERLGADIAAIAEIGADRRTLRTVAASADGQPAAFEYAIAGSACEAAMKKGLYVCVDGLGRRFPNGPALPGGPVEGYAAAALVDSAGAPIGVLAVASRGPLRRHWEAAIVLRIFAVRASFELERRRQEAVWRDREARAERYRSALLGMVRGELLAWDDPDQTLNAVTEIAGRTLGVQRTGVWRFDADAFVCVDFYEAAARRHDRGQELSAQRLPSYLAALRRDRLVDAGDAASDPRTAELAADYLAPLGIGALLDASVDSGGTLAGVVSFEHVGGPRPWTPEDRLFARAIADFVALLFSVEEGRRAHRALAESEERYRSLVELSPDAIVVLVEGRIAYANPAAVALFNAGSLENLQVWRFLDLVRRGSRRPLMAYLRAVGEKRARPAIEGELARLDGVTIVAETAASAVVYAGKPAVQLVIRDTTQQKEMEAQLVQSAKLATLGEATAGIIHELSQPLNIIKLAAELALLQVGRGQAPPEYLEKQLRVIEGQATRMGEIVGRMRLFGRKEGDDEEDFDPLAPLRSAVDMLGQRFAVEDIRLTLDLVAGPLVVRGRAVRLEQVIVNLLTNARDAIAERRRRLGAAPAHEGAIAVVARTEGDAEGEGFLVISIADNGIGIPPDKVDRIFEPFFTTKEGGQGMGLGLSICRSIVAQMSGRLWARNSSDGAVFEMRLPCRPGAAAAAAEANSAAGGGEPLLGPPLAFRALVVDDEKEAARAVADFLANRGFEVRTAGDGEEAYALFCEEPPHLVVTDIRMPRSDGKKLIRSLRELDPELPIIVVTGDIGVAAALAADIPGEITPVLKKPISLADLGAVAAELLAPRREPGRQGTDLYGPAGAV